MSETYPSICLPYWSRGGQECLDVAIARRQDTSPFFWRGPYNTIYVDDDTDVDDNVEVAAEVTLAEVTVDVGVRAAAC